MNNENEYITRRKCPIFTTHLIVEDPIEEEEMKIMNLFKKT
jgi:hypothetical protein